MTNSSAYRSGTGSRLVISRKYPWRTRSTAIEPLGAAGDWGFRSNSKFETSMTASLFGMQGPAFWMCGPCISSQPAPKGSKRRR